MSFGIALSGLNAASSQLDVVSHNIANVNTTGFKSSRAHFSDVFAGSSSGSNTTVGSGVKLSSVYQQFGSGSIDFTQNNLDFAIKDEGFFVLNGNNGNVFSRAGAFNLDNSGYVVDSSSNRLQVFPPNASGTGFVTGQTVDLQIQTTLSSPVATSEADIGVNLPANQTPPPASPFDPTQSDTYNYTTSTTVYDSLGASHFVDLYYVKDAGANDWTTYTYIDGVDMDSGTSTPTPQDLQFNSFGAQTVPASGQIPLSYTPTNGSQALSITFDYNSTTQFGDTFAINNLDTNGAPSGRLTGIEVDDTGAVAARFTNGQLQNLGQIVMANFSNPQGLSQLGDTSWGESFQSGSARMGVAGTSDFGTIVSGALESSNVNLTEQLVEMISAQRNFEANAQVISTADAITQQIINIR